MTWIPKPQEIYKHFKGNMYQIVTLAEHSETGEMLVVYQALYGEYKVYARPLRMFTGKVDREKYPEVVQEYRFERQDVTSQKEKLPENEDELSVENKTVETQEPAKQREIASHETDIAAEEYQLDPLVLEFLDADSHEKRLNILAALHHRITDSMITTMAVACDVEVPEGDIETRYNELKSCLVMLDKFEIRR